MKLLINEIDYSSYINDIEISSYTDSQFLLGNAISKKMELELDNSTGVFNSLLNYPFTIKLENDLLIGTFYLYEPLEKYTSVLELVMYDSMLKLNKYNTIDSICTIQTIINSMKTDCDVPTFYVEEGLDLTVEIPFYDTGITWRKYLSYIAEMLGCNLICKNDVIGFYKLNTIPITTGALYDYSRGELLTINTVCFNNGLINLESSIGEGYTMYLNPENPLIDTNYNIHTLDNYLGTSFYTCEDVNFSDTMQAVINVFDTVEVLEGFNTLALSVALKWLGSDDYEYDIECTLPSNQSASAVNDLQGQKIRQLKVVVDATENKVNIIAQEKNELTNELSNLIIDKDQILQRVEKTENDINNNNTRFQSVETSISSLEEHLISKITEKINDNNSGYVNEQISNIYNTINGLEIENIQRELDDHNEILNEYKEYVKIGNATIEVGCNNAIGRFNPEGIEFIDNGYINTSIKDGQLLTNTIVIESMHVSDFSLRRFKNGVVAFVKEE